METGKAAGRPRDDCHLVFGRQPLDDCNICRRAPVALAGQAHLMRRQRRRRRRRVMRGRTRLRGSGFGLKGFGLRG